MTTFKVRNVSGGFAFWHTNRVEAKDLQDLAAKLEARVVNSCPGWAFLQAGETTSFEATWTPERNQVNRQPANT